MQITIAKTLFELTTGDIADQGTDDVITTGGNLKARHTLFSNP